MPKVFFMFSGQGAQKAGMGRDFYDSYPEARRLFDSAAGVMGEGFIRTVFEGPEDELKKTEITQPAVFLVSYVIARIFESESALRAVRVVPELVAGHSLGEYTAAAFAGAVDFEAGIRLIKARGEFIRDASARRPGTMAAVMGVEAKLLAGICETVSSGEETVQPVNYNTPDQTVISGSTAAVALARERIKEQAPKAKVIPLKVSGAFHSRLMAQAAEAMRRKIAEYDFSDIREGLRFMSAMDLSSVSEGKDVKELLIRQIDNPVRWTELAVTLGERGFDTGIEFGPGEVLSGLVKKSAPSISVFSVNSVEKLKNVLEVLRNVS